MSALSCMQKDHEWGRCLLAASQKKYLKNPALINWKGSLIARAVTSLKTWQINHLRRSNYFSNEHKSILLFKLKAVCLFVCLFVGLLTGQDHILYMNTIHIYESPHAGPMWASVKTNLLLFSYQSLTVLHCPKAKHFGWLSQHTSTYRKTTCTWLTTKNISTS